VKFIRALIFPDAFAASPIFCGSRNVASGQVEDNVLVERKIPNRKAFQI
jgi:hypothetical protein